jgi:probable addiction module antidote protein
MANRAVSPFDAADYLDSPEARAEYASAALETGAMPFILDAINIVARAKGIAEVAEAGPTSLYETLQPDGNPGFETLLRLSVQPTTTSPS